MSIIKNMPLKWYFSMKKFFGKIRIIFDIENWLWKSEIVTFRSHDLELTLIYQKLFKMKKCYLSLNYTTISCGSCWKILKWYLNYLWPNTYFSTGATSVHIMNQCHRVFTVGYVVPRGSIFRQRLSEKIFQLAAAGLIDKAFEDVYDGVALLAAERGVQVSAPVKLGLFHLQAKLYTSSTIKLTVYSGSYNFLFLYSWNYELITI